MSVPNHKDGNADVLYDRRPTDPDFFQVGATFDSPKDEHYYGLGQNQEGYPRSPRPRRPLLRTTTNAPPAQRLRSVRRHKQRLRPLWDNPSKTTISLGFNEQTRWTSQVGHRVSFFVIAGNTVRRDLRRLSSAHRQHAHAAQVGLRLHPVQAALHHAAGSPVDVAKGYRDRHLPADVMVIDWFYYTKMGQMDMDPASWPDPVAMNKQLHDMRLPHHDQRLAALRPRDRASTT